MQPVEAHRCLAEDVQRFLDRSTRDVVQASGRRSQPGEEALYPPSHVGWPSQRQARHLLREPIHFVADSRRLDVGSQQEIDLLLGAGFPDGLVDRRHFPTSHFVFWDLTTRL